MSNHTPGPWVVIDRRGPGAITCEVCYGTDEECITDGVYVRADAVLMAAAPTMLDALEAVLHEYEYGSFDGLSCSMDKVRDAIFMAKDYQ